MTTMAYTAPFAISQRSRCTAPNRPLNKKGIDNEKASKGLVKSVADPSPQITHPRRILRFCRTESAWGRRPLYAKIKTAGRTVLATVCTPGKARSTRDAVSLFGRG